MEPRIYNVAFLRAHIFLLLVFAIFGCNNIIMASSLLPKLAFSWTGDVCKDSCITRDTIGRHILHTQCSRFANIMHYRAISNTIG